MAIRFLADGNIDNDLQIQTQLIVGDGSASYSKIANNAINLYDSAGVSKGQVFVNESGSSHLLMINNGTSGGTVYFGAPTGAYVQNVIIQGGTLTIGGISNASSDTDKFLVSDSGEVKYRTGAQVRSDIGAGTGDGTITGSGTAGYGAKFSTSTALTSSRFFESNAGTFYQGGSSAEFPLNIQAKSGNNTHTFEGDSVSNESNFQITPGTVSKPGINFGGRNGTGANDTNTGIYSSAADKMEFATGGSERVQITSNGTKLTTLNALSSAASLFLVSDSGILKTRTPAQVRSDIGAGTGSGDVTSVGITAGTGISVSGSPITSSGSITVTNSAPDQTVALTAGTGISISGTYPNFTITNSSPSSGGTVTGSGSSGRVAFWNGSSSITSEADFLWNGNTLTLGGSANASEYNIEIGKGRTNDGYAYIDLVGDSTYTDYGLRLIRGNSGANTSSDITHRGTGIFSINTQDSAILQFKTGNTERGQISGAGIQTIGLSSDPTLYLDLPNKKVGFRTSSPGAAFDVNGTIRVRNQLNVGHTTEQNLYVNGNGAAGGQYVKMGNYGTGGNYFGLTSSENQPKYTAAFGSGGKIVQDRRIMTVKIAASAINSYHTDAGVEIIPSPGSGNIIWPMSIFIYRGAGSPGTGWPASNTAVGASFYMCDQVNTCSSLNRIANIASGVCKSNTGTWFWGRPVPLPSLNENPQVEWLLDNKNLRFKTAANISNATMDWYVRIEYLQMNITAGFTNNVDATIT